MILSHLGKSPTIPPDADVAPTATVCGDVRLAAGVRVMFGACGPSSAPSADAALAPR